MNRKLTLLCGSAAVAAGIMMACSDDDIDGTKPYTGVDASDGATADAPVTDDGGPIADPDAGSASSRIFVASDLAAVSSATRYCVLASKTSDEPTLDDAVDLPPFPVSATGLGAGVVTPAEISMDLTGHSVRFGMFYVSSLDAFNLSGKTCKEIVASIVRPGSSPSAVLVEGADFEVGPAVPKTFFRADRSYVLLATGCPKASSIDADYNCPTNADGGVFDNTFSTFRTIAHELDPTPASSPDKNRVQFLYGSDSLMVSLPVDGVASNLMGTTRYSEADGGARREVVTGAQSDGSQLMLDTSGPLLPAPGTEVTDLRTMESFGFELAMDYPPFIRDVAWINELSPITVSSVQPGKAYTFMIIGSPAPDPDLPDGGKNPAAFHIALIPND